MRRVGAGQEQGRSRAEQSKAELGRKRAGAGQELGRSKECAGWELDRNCIRSEASIIIDHVPTYSSIF